jgi:hypothetical protein
LRQITKQHGHRCGKLRDSDDDGEEEDKDGEDEDDEEEEEDEYEQVSALLSLLRLCSLSMPAGGKEEILNEEGVDERESDGDEEGGFDSCLIFF